MQIPTRSVEVILANGEERKFAGASVNWEDGVLMIVLDEDRGVICFPLVHVQQWDMR